MIDKVYLLLPMFFIAMFLQSCEKIASDQPRYSLNPISTQPTYQYENKTDNIGQMTSKTIFLENFKENTFDFNQDGLMDKIVLTKPADMDDRNFNVTIEILQNTGNDYQKIVKNAIILEEPTSGCGLDGLEEILGDKGNLNIVYRTCIDRKFATRNLLFVFDDNSKRFTLKKNEIVFSDVDGNTTSHMCQVTHIDFAEFDGACY